MWKKVKLQKILAATVKLYKSKEKNVFFLKLYFLYS